MNFEQNWSQNTKAARLISYMDKKSEIHMGKKSEILSGKNSLLTTIPKEK